MNVRFLRPAAVGGGGSRRGGTQEFSRVVSVGGKDSAVMQWKVVAS